MEGSATATLTGTLTYGSAATLQYNTATARTSGTEWITPFTATGGVIIANTGSITMAAAKVLNTSVPLTINNGATLAAGNFALTLGGNFINSGTFTAGTGTVTFSGGSAQTISGLSATTFYNLTINNTSGVTASTDLIVNGVLTLQSANPSSGLTGSLDMGAKTLTLVQLPPLLEQVMLPEL